MFVLPQSPESQAVTWTTATPDRKEIVCYAVDSFEVVVSFHLSNLTSFSPLGNLSLNVVVMFNTASLYQLRRTYINNIVIYTKAVEHI